MPHVLIKYAHVLICISAGKGSRHFSAIYLYGNEHCLLWVEIQADLKMDQYNQDKLDYHEH